MIIEAELLQEEKVLNIYKECKEILAIFTSVLHTLKVKGIKNSKL